jgi:hypothetical protein
MRRLTLLVLAGMLCAVSVSRASDIDLLGVNSGGEVMMPLTVTNTTAENVTIYRMDTTQLGGSAMFAVPAGATVTVMVSAPPNGPLHLSYKLNSDLVMMRRYGVFIVPIGGAYSYATR